MGCYYTISQHRPLRQQHELVTYMCIHYVGFPRHVMSNYAHPSQHHLMLSQHALLPILLADQTQVSQTRQVNIQRHNWNTAGTALHTPFL